MSLAIEQAGIDPYAIDQISVSANYSSELDRMEHNQLKKVFTGRKNNLAVTPLKYLMGDFGGAGAIRAAAILLSLHHQLPLPTVSTEILKGEHQRCLVWDIPLTGKTNVALMSTTTYGGGSTSLVFTKSDSSLESVG
jgi:3-oxoacyl-[acyl-carrier-protein] synthase II